MDVNFRVLGLDPGGTTGWSCYDAFFVPSPAGKPELVEQKLTVGHLADDKHDHHEELYELLEDRAIEDYWVVCESFEYRNSPQSKHRDNIDLSSKEYIGVVKLFGQQRKMGRRVQFMTAGQSKKFIPDKPDQGLPANAKLKVMGWYYPGFKHANDATRVLVNHLVNYHKRTDLIQCWRTLV